MSFGRIWAVFLRYFYYFSKLDQIAELFYWPAVDILLWGMTSMWLQKQDPQLPEVALAVLTGLIFWQVVWRGTYEIAVNMLQEFWNRNMVNLFSTPLKLGEWMSATMLIGVVKSLISLSFGSFLVWLLYSLNVFSMGWAFIPFYFSLTLSGWFIGYISAGIMVYYGQRFQMLAWMTPFVFAPFSAVFYPVSVLPEWAQVISQALPLTYVFEGMRKILFEHSFSMSDLFISYGLNVVYLTVCMLFFRWMFEKSKRKGLARLE